MNRTTFFAYDSLKLNYFDSGESVESREYIYDTIDGVKVINERTFDRGRDITPLTDSVTYSQAFFLQRKLFKIAVTGYFKGSIRQNDYVRKALYYIKDDSVIEKFEKGYHWPVKLLASRYSRLSERVNDTLKLKK